MSHTYTTNAIVLRRWPIGETDRVHVLYTEARGKISAIGRGVRRPTSKLGGYLELFYESTLVLAEGRTFDTIASAELVEQHVPLRQSVERIHASHYCAEAVLRLVGDESPVDRLFALLQATFRSLDHGASVPGTIASFQLKLLAILGFRPSLTRCVHCQDRVTSVEAFDLIHGGVVCAACSVGRESELTACSERGRQCLTQLLGEPVQVAAAGEPGFDEANRIIEQAILVQTNRPLASRPFLVASPASV